MKVFYMCNNNQKLTLEQKAAIALRDAAKGYVIHYDSKDYKVEWLNATLQEDINEENAEILFNGDAKVSIQYENHTESHSVQVRGSIAIENYKFSKINSIHITFFMN